jgi:hypothetical protein
MNTEVEKQIPLIIYRLDTTAQVLEEVKQVLERQTENMSSLLVLQEKHNNLQSRFNEKVTELESLKNECQKNSTFRERFFTGLYVAVFLFGIIQSGILWWVNTTTDNISKLETKIEMIEKKK